MNLISRRRAVSSKLREEAARAQSLSSTQKSSAKTRRRRLGKAGYDSSETGSSTGMGTTFLWGVGLGIILTLGFVILKWLVPQRSSEPSSDSSLRPATSPLKVQTETSLKSSEGLSSPLENSEGLTVVVESSESLRPFMNRGPFFIQPDSGCYIARWVWNSGPRDHADCRYVEDIPPEKILDTRISQVKQFDTIYVPITLLQTFVNQALPEIQVPIVLISGTVRHPRKPKIKNEVVETILANKWVRKWFCQNLQAHLPNANRKNGIIHPFPYGLSFVNADPQTLDYDPKEIFADAFHRHLDDYGSIDRSYKALKTEVYWKDPQDVAEIVDPKRVFNAHDALDDQMHNSAPKRQEYLEAIAKSQFVLASNPGKRPEHSRVFEALAFGAIPVTEWKTEDHTHLLDGPVLNEEKAALLEIESNPTIALDQLLQDLDKQRVVDRTNPKHVFIQRRLVMEDYWLLWIEQKLNEPLWWWDRVSQKPAQRDSLQDLPLFIPSAFPAQF